MLPGRRYTPADIWDLILRYKWLILVPWVAVAIGMAMFTRTLENRYVSDSLLQIVAARVPQNLVRSTITSSIEERLPIINQQIMSRTRLERIVQDLGLYTEERRNGQLMEDIVRTMRDNHIRVTPVKGDAFRVSFESSDPRLAMRVTEKLATLFIEENLRDRETQSANTNSFLDSQLDDARRRLFESEKKVEEYNREYRTQLPSQLGANLAQQSNLEARLQQNSEMLLRDKDRRQLLERQVPDVEAEIAAAQLMPAGDEAGLSPAAMPAAARLSQARAQQAQLELRLKPDHPEMKTLERVIRDLEERAEQEALQTPLSGAPRARNPIEAARLKRLADLKAEIANVDAQMVAREATAKQLQRAIAEIQSRVDATPTRQSEMIAITRDYDTFQSIYTSLLSKSEDAKVAANLERRQIGEQFKIIDTARLPERPSSPDRTAYYGGGAVGGLLVGLVLVGLLEYRDTSFRSDTDIVTFLALPVLATIPAIVTREDRRRRRRRRRRTWIAAAIGGGLLVAAVVVWRSGLLQRLF